ncbi:MAG TPA: FtsX-like permease family protein [Candidatus Eisenbacteria bacterium]|nr:FtsX-like permease family protein [Candidatus Eisenbacteria bacterium]
MTLSSTFRIGWRNLWRNKRRTLLAVAAVGLSQALVLFYGGILTGYGDWMVETITGPLLGHAQAHAPGWRKDRAMDRALPNVEAALRAIRSDPDVANASARIYAPALAAKGEQGHAIVVVGIAPRLEAGRSGLLAGSATLPAGKRVLVGRSLAVRMGVTEGDTLALVGQGADGSLANDLYVVAASVSTPVDLVNRSGLLMDLPEAQSLFAMPDAAHEIVIHARDPRRSAAVAARVAARPELRGAEVIDWERLAPELVSLVELVRAAWLFVLALVFIAAAAGVANTMLMATFERTREIGMLLALGCSPRRILRMIVVESVTLGVLGALAGTALGVGGILAAHRGGLDLSRMASGAPQELAFAGLQVSMRIFPAVNALHVVQGFVAVVLTALVASIWPAARAARLQPSRAMRG